jgi:hydroxymethylglutaryl-CoA lyase
MADTPILLPQLPRVEADPMYSPADTRSASPFSGRPLTPRHITIPLEENVVHYPVLVPNMRGLDNLLKLEEQACRRLTDEIAVFVSATEVSFGPVLSQLVFAQLAVGILAS